MNASARNRTFGEVQADCTPAAGGCAAEPAPDGAGYAGRSPDWVEFGFADPAAGATWATACLSPLAARVPMGRPAAGLARGPVLAGPCVSARAVVPVPGGWATRVEFRVPPGPAGASRGRS